MDIPVYVVNQKLRIAMNYKTLVSGTNGFINFVFNVPDDWDGLRLIAQFKQNNVKHPVDVVNGIATLPQEIVAGVCTMILYGVDSSGETVGITDYVKLRIKDNDKDGNPDADSSTSGGSSGSSSGSGNSSGGTLVMTDDGEGNVTIVTV